MQNIEKKKKMSISKAHAQSIEAKQRDDVRILHEAYQFLSRRYMSMGNKNSEEEDFGISPMQMLDAQNSGFNFGKSVDEDDNKKEGGENNGDNVDNGDDGDKIECENVVDDNISVENVPLE